MYHYFLELQNRVLYLLVFFFLIFTLNYYYKEALFYFLVKPVFFSASKELSYYFIYTNITEVFFTYFKISVLIAFYVLIPYTAIQVWKFIIPGLYLSEQFFLNIFVTLFLLIWVNCNIFIYLLLIPSIWSFFSEFDFTAGNPLIPFFFEAKLGEYITFITKIFFSFSFICQLFFFSLMFLFKYTASNLKMVKRIRPYIYITTFSFACLITPPDVLSQLMVAIPFIIFYEIIIIYLLIHNEYYFFYKNVPVDSNKEAN